MAVIVWEMWVSASDSRVCGRCARLHGLMFREGEGPMPPIHPFCRCSRVRAFTQDVGDPDDAPGAGGKPVDPEDLIPKPVEPVLDPMPGNPAPRPVPPQPAPGGGDLPPIWWPEPIWIPIEEGDDDDRNRVDMPLPGSE